MNRRSIGQRGEDLASKFFIKKKYNIVERNFRCHYGEIDLILKKNSSFRFVEVKFRRTEEYGLPQESVVKKKQRRIRNAAVFWLRLRNLPLDMDIHFDVLAIIEDMNKIKYDYIENAF